MKKIAALLLALAMTVSLCACRDMLYDEHKSPVPKFDMTVSYSFDDETLTEDPDGSEVYYSQSLGTASVHSDNNDKAAAAINESLGALYARLRDEAGYTKRVAADQPDDNIFNLYYRCTPKAARCDTRVLSLVFDVAQYTGGVPATICGAGSVENAIALVTLAAFFNQLLLFKQFYQYIIVYQKLIFFIINKILGY